MNNATFWESVNTIINEGFTPEGLQKLDHYAELFISERIIYKRFSQIEQHGCSKGGTTNVIATLLSGAKISSNNSNEIICDFKKECQQAAEQAECIEKNPRNWTYATPDIYLSDIHDENIIRSISGNIFVIDCDIRINIPELKADGIRHLTTEVEVKY